MNSVEDFYTSAYCDVGYNRDLDAVQTRWKGLMVSGIEFRKILDAIISLLEIKKCHCVIADAREMKIIIYEDQQWIINNWYPRALKAGFRQQALVVAKSTYGELSIKKIVEKYDQVQVTTGYFDSMEEAFRWVKATSLAQGTASRKSN